jgi:hypothetical protein
MTFTFYDVLEINRYFKPFNVSIFVLMYGHIKRGSNIHQMIIITGDNLKMLLLSADESINRDYIKPVYVFLHDLWRV